MTNVAIVYDWIDKWGGVERVLLTLHEMMPDADFYSSYYDPEKAPWAKDLKIKTSFIQKFPEFVRRNRLVSFPFYPFAFESFNFSKYDLVISVTSSFAKSIITKPGTKHICYLLTPTRYFWINKKLYLKNSLIRFLLSGYFESLKKWDFVAAQRPDKMISISNIVAERCKKFYNRDSEVIYPPFDTEYWGKIKSEIRNPKFEINPKLKILNSQKYFLVVSRLEPYKRVDLVIQSIKRLDRLLVIVGEGSEEDKLKRIAGKNVQFYSKLTDEELGYLYQNAEALIMPQEEDFGYVSLEAQFFGCPVIAYKKGGAMETILENKTGIFFEKQNIEGLQSAFEKFDMIKYGIRDKIRESGKTNIERFAKEKFIKNFNLKI